MAAQSLEKLLPMLACPIDGEGFDQGDAGTGVTTLICARGHGFPVIDGVPHLSPGKLLSGPAPAAETVGSEWFSPRAARQVKARFENQWRLFGGSKLIFGKNRGAMRELITGDRVGSRIDGDFYRGKTILEAGCGHGRYVEEFAKLGATTVGLDIGDHLPSIASKIPEEIRGRTHFVQGDALRPPFRPEIFDLVFCDGVLHHTRNPRFAFTSLSRLLSHRGGFYVWVYPRGGWLWEVVNRGVRSITTLLPVFALRVVGYGLAPILFVVPTYSRTKLSNASWGECAQVIYDWLSPAIQTHHTEAEIEEWFRGVGLEEIERLPVPVGMIGWRPGPGSKEGT